MNIPALKAIWWKLLLAILAGPIGWLPINNGEGMLITSSLGELIRLILLLGAIVKIAGKKPSGWLWGAAFFYYGAFGQIGIVAWAYLGLAAGGLWAYQNWLASREIDPA
jgi:hypothetical protein